MNVLMQYLLWGWKVSVWTPRGNKVKVWLLPANSAWYNYITMHI